MSVTEVEALKALYLKLIEPTTDSCFTAAHVHSSHILLPGDLKEQANGKAEHFLENGDISGFIKFLELMENTCTAISGKCEQL